MNRFGTYETVLTQALVYSIFLLWGFFGQAVAQPLSPYFGEGGLLFADIDTTNQRVFVVVDEGLWQYNLAEEEWAFLDSLESLSDHIQDLEFGYNEVKECIQFWSRGVGEVYELDLQSYEINRIDNSHRHRNQFRHFPFHREGTIQAFGGYGYWEWRNFITFYNEKINEWSLQNVHPQSEKPQRRKPFTGAFDSDADMLYLFGGESTKLDHPDDQYASHYYHKDIWEFSFTTNQWKRLMTFEDSDFMFYMADNMKKVGRINVGSTSFIVPGRKLWFLPVVSPDKPEEVFYLKPVDLLSSISYPRIQMNLGRAIDFYPTNFLYDPQNAAAVIVGFDNLSNTSRYPVRIVQIPFESLATRLETPPFWLSLSPFYYLIAGMAFVLGIILLFIYHSERPEEVKNLPFSQADLLQHSWFNDQEKKLLKLMTGDKKLFDSQEIEEHLWGHQKSYDYRRRLRNDIIKSINNKFKKHFPRGGKLIVRQKDPEDNRRYLYTINADKIKD